jgi:hypothetical protein
MQKTYFSEETTKKLVKIGFYETVQYYKVKDKLYPKLPEPNELVTWLRENKDVYIVVVPDPGHPLNHQFKYFVYAPDDYNGRPRLVLEGVNFDFDSATIDAILDYLNKEII